MPVSSTSLELRLARIAGAILLVVADVGLVLLLLAAAMRDGSELRPSGPGTLPSGPPAVIGRIARLGDQTFVASAYSEERTVRVDPDTVVMQRDAPAHVADLRPGRGVIVWGDEDAAHVVHARTILVSTVP